MKALVLKEKGKIKYIEKEEPHLEAEHGAIIKPIYVSPCTSDVHTIWQGSPKRENLTLGHECVGEVLKIGKNVKDFSVGDIVAVPAITPLWSDLMVNINPSHAGHNFSAHMLGKSIDGAFQERFYLPFADNNLSSIPKGLSLLDALMCVDVLSTGFTAAEEAAIKPNDTVVIMGIGAIGLAAIMASKYMGAKKIYAVGSRDENALIAEKLGAELINYKTCKAALPSYMHPLANSTGSNVVNKILTDTKGKGVDAVLICGGDDLSLPKAIDMVKYGSGIVSNVMYYGADIEKLEKGEMDSIEIPKFSIGRGMAGKTLKFSLSRGGRKWTEKILKICLEEQLNPSIFITKTYEGLGNIEKAIYDMRDRKAIKIAVKID